MRVKRPAKTKTRNIVASERRARAVALRKDGKTFAEIGAALGFSPQRAHKILTEKLDELNALSTTETAALRQQQLDQIGTLKQWLWAMAKKGNLGAIDRLERLMNREAKLAGLDAAEKYEHSGPGGGPIDIASMRERVHSKLTALLAPAATTAPPPAPPAEREGEDPFE